MQLGSTVTLTYKGTTPDGEVFGYATAESPMKFQTGMDMVIDGLEKAILEMNEVGEKKTVVVSQYEAYGEYIEDLTATIPKFQVPRQNIMIGDRIWMGNDDGDPAPATCIDITADGVVFDLNHPLAGKDLTFEIEILEIEAAPENFVSQAEKDAHMEEQKRLLGQG